MVLFHQQTSLIAIKRKKNTEKECFRVNKCKIACKINCVSHQTWLSGMLCRFAFAAALNLCFAFGCGPIMHAKLYICINIISFSEAKVPLY